LPRTWPISLSKHSQADSFGLDQLATQKRHGTGTPAVTDHMSNFTAKINIDRYTSSCCSSSQWFCQLPCLPVASSNVHEIKSWRASASFLEGSSEKQTMFGCSTTSRPSPPRRPADGATSPNPGLPEVRRDTVRSRRPTHPEPGGGRHCPIQPARAWPRARPISTRRSDDINGALSCCIQALSFRKESIIPTFCVIN
jgi:hypothetical protein